MSQYLIESIPVVLNKFVTSNKKRKIIKYKGFNIKTNSERYILFKEKGTNCISCGAVGEFFILEQTLDPSNINNLFHFNLYAFTKNKNLVLMTKDHIIPISKGGKNKIENYQPMCKPCNEKKSNMLKEVKIVLEKKDD